MMFGWEFPPMSSGGLGTACYGLTKGLSRKGIDVTFVVPYADDVPDYDFLKLIPAGRVKIRKIFSRLKPYMTSEEYASTIRKAPKRTAKIYGATLFEEVYRYTMARSADSG